ncbi:hypothetical protein [Streptomyces celluloflavus]|uniref:hypothetical protein n=1 Tax=Streptomyces celluloflavus TaxID=58344 RepID=UPI0034615EB1|nr:hypothetical protein OG717_29755 [Streptomyces celluloflavus]
MTDSGYHIGLEEAVLRAKRRATAADEEGTWPMQLAADLRELGANWQESADACADVAWAARAAQRSVLRLMQPAQTTGHGADEATERTYRHLYLSSLRFDFRCRAVQTLVGEGVSLSQLSRDPYTAALYAFAFLGQSKSRGLNLMEEVLSRAGDHPKTLHVLVHGLWLGQELPGRAEHILQLLARPPFTPRTDPIALFREAGALRSLGHYRAALASISRALDLLPPGDPAVHADFVRERALICAADDLARLSGRGAEGGPA